MEVNDLINTIMLLIYLLFIHCSKLKLKMLTMWSTWNNHLTSQSLSTCAVISTISFHYFGFLIVQGTDAEYLYVLSYFLHFCQIVMRYKEYYGLILFLDEMRYPRAEEKGSHGKSFLCALSWGLFLVIDKHIYTQLRKNIISLITNSILRSFDFS